VANDSRKQQPISVASIEGWKMRQANERPAASAEGRLAKEEVRRLSRAQKQAALLRLILSDSVAETDLEAMIQAAGSLAPEGGVKSSCARSGGPSIPITRMPEAAIPCFARSTKFA
jgi:hypothetical protein